eukprot:TRINITY_DN15352_c0_g2_i1.p1 TRINITY_DN15352_c0_g2~~TRINITY_DN15352_c0_g2_i1.p1  ORF type:complete len:989 (+),score=316.96 TRINITY_DN15352_c0_g2_i1:156-3122(+)
MGWVDPTLPPSGGSSVAASLEGSSQQSVIESVGPEVGAGPQRGEISTGHTIWHHRQARGRGRGQPRARPVQTPAIGVARLPPHRDAALLAKKEAEARYGVPTARKARTPILRYREPEPEPEVEVSHHVTPPPPVPTRQSGDDTFDTTLASMPYDDESASPPPPDPVPQPQIEKDHISVMHIPTGKLMMVTPERAAASSTPAAPYTKRVRLRDDSPTVTPPKRRAGRRTGGSPVYDFDSPGVLDDEGRPRPETYRHVYELLPEYARNPLLERERVESPLSTFSRSPRSAPGDLCYTPRQHPAAKKRAYTPTTDVVPPDDHPTFCFVAKPHYGTRSPDFAPKIKPLEEKDPAWHAMCSAEADPVRGALRGKDGAVKPQHDLVSPTRRAGGAGYPDAWRAPEAASPQRTPHDDPAVQEALASGEWASHRDPETNRRYYVHSGSNLSVWNLSKELRRRRKQLESEAVEDALDCGIWKMAVDPATQAQYYYHPETGKTCWELGEEAVYNAEKELEQLEAAAAAGAASEGAETAAGHEASSDDDGGGGFADGPVLSPLRRPARPDSVTQMMLVRDLVGWPQHPSYERMQLAVPEGDVPEFPILGLEQDPRRRDVSPDELDPPSPPTAHAVGAPTQYPVLKAEAVPGAMADRVKLPGPQPKDSKAWSLSPEDKKVRWKWDDRFADDDDDYVDGDQYLQSPDAAPQLAFPQDPKDARRLEILAKMEEADLGWDKKRQKIPPPEFDALPPPEAADEDWKHADPTGVGALRSEAEQQQVLQEGAAFKPSVTKKVNKKDYDAQGKWGGVNYLTDDAKPAVEHQQKMKEQFEGTQGKLKGFEEEYEAAKAALVALPAPPEPIARSPPRPEVEHPYGIRPLGAPVPRREPDYGKHPEKHPLYPFHLDAEGNVKEVPEDPRRKRPREPSTPPPLRVRDADFSAMGPKGPPRGPAPPTKYNVPDPSLPELPYLSPVKAVRLVPDGGDAFTLYPGGETLTRTAV